MIITMTAWRRPDYTAQVIRSIERAVKPDSLLVLVSLEPGNPEVRGVLESYNGDIKIHENKEPLGCSQNTLQIIKWGLEYEDQIIHVEDDTVLAKDALNYFYWGLQHYRDDKRTSGICGWHRVGLPTDDTNVVFRDPVFMPWGFASWRDRLEPTFDKWPDKRWDIYLRKNSHLWVFPILGRIQNIGRKNGVHPNRGIMQRVHCEYWADAQAIHSNFIPIEHYFRWRNR